MCFADKKVASMSLQNVSVEDGTSFISVQRVPTTTKALKQAVTMQPVIVGVDASDWSDYYSVSGLYSSCICKSSLCKSMSSFQPD